MKILKNSLQKNVVVDKSMYTKEEIKDMLYQGRVFLLQKIMKFQEMKINTVMNMKLEYLL